jgi:hypothetical protein
VSGYLPLVETGDEENFAGVAGEHQFGRTIEAFSAWRHPQVVFDLDAEVGPTPLATNAEGLLQELRSLISRT